MAAPITCSVFIATSVDGFIAREDDALDFLPGGGGEEHGYTAFIASVDAVVMGRRTLEKVLTFGQWPFTKPVIVLSSRPWSGKLPQGVAIEFMSGEPGAVVARLAERGMKHLYVDGGATIQRFLGAGLIGRMTITRVPVLIGRGIPLFGQLSRDIRLEHVNTRAYPSGLVTSEYLVSRG